MLPRDELFNLYQNTLKVISTADVWTEFLKTASFNYKYEFDDQILIYAQNPKATVLLSSGQWNERFHRNITSSQSGISLFALPEEPEQVKLVYDITDTQTDKNSIVVPIFKFNNSKEHQNNVISVLNHNYGLNEKEIKKAIYSSAVNLTNDKLDAVFPEFLNSVQGTPANNYSNQLIRIKAETFIAKSATYMCLSRCGLSTIKRNFREVSLFGDKTIITLGTLMSSIAAEIIKYVIRAELKMADKSYENYQHTIAIGEQKSYNKAIGRDTAQSERMGQYGNELFRTEKASISQREQTDSLHGTENNRAIGAPPSRNSESGREPMGNGDQQQSDVLGPDGRTQEKKYDEMDGVDDQSPRNHAGTGSERDGLQLKLNNPQKVAEFKNTLPLFLSQEQVDNLLIKGSYVSARKYRIFEQFQKKETIKENVAFLKEEYGIEGSCGPNEIRVAYSGKGITFSDSNLKNVYHMPWNTVAKRIDQLISANRYLTPSEIEAYPEYRAEKAAREQRKVISENFKNLINDFNDIVEKKLNQYILNIDCMNEFVIGRTDITFQKSRKGDNIYTLIYEALGQIKTVPEFIKRAVALEKTFQPYRTDIKTEFKQKIEYQYNYHTGDTVYIGTKKFEIAAVTPDILLEDISFPLYQEHYTEKAFKEKLNENPLNDHLKVIVSDRVKTETIEKEPEQNTNPRTETPFEFAKRQNFRIRNPELGSGTRSKRFQNNIAAIRTLKTVENEKRNATADEQEIMSKYVGWGGLADCFEEKHTGYNELKSLITEAEYEAARASTLTAFYTPPIVIEYIYRALANMGFQTGNLLDPACGTGHFIGMLPDKMKKSKVYGVEIDSLSGRIAKQLYPKAAIAVEGFEKTTLPDSFFDIVVGNVPFGDFKIYDNKFNKYKFLIHDYFFAKSLDKVRPGGVIAFITSKGTLDKPNPAVRKYIAQRADLIGAIRLPDNTFKGAAGTEVTSDILFLRKRERAIEAEPDWLYLDTDNNGITMNRYFIDHPEMVLGNMVMESSRFGNDSVCKADETFSLAEQLEKAIIHLNAKVVEKEMEEPKQEAPSSIPADPDVRPFSYTIVDGHIYFRENSVMELCNPQQKAKERIKGMIAIRDSVRRLLDYQTNDYPEADIKAEQVKLNELYDQFVKEYGVLTSRTNKSAFRDDSSAPLLYALEILDDEGKFERKADIFTKRTINASKKITHADTAADALAASISEKACVDLGYMAQLMGGSDHIEEIALNLKGVIFKDPVTGPFDFNGNWASGWQTADEYLSGNIREKMRLAQEAAIKYPEFKENVNALKKVYPKDLTAAEISVRLGSTWVPADIYNQFIYELLETPIYMRKSVETKYIRQTGEWKLSNRTFDKGNIKAYSSYGTKRANAYRIIEDTLNLRDVRIYDKKFDDEGKEKSVLNTKETAVAQGKQELIKQAFASWIWKDPKRRRDLCNLYNETFNSTRPREYNGQHIIYHGMNPQITMRSHQNDAVAHMLYGNKVLLAHVVGAGKTFEMVAGAMESKYLGLCQKSIFVVPNHLVEQWASEFLLLYPNANLLVTRKEDFQKENRKRFCSKIATGEFDAIIIGQSQFEKIPMSIERQEEMIRRQIADLLAGIKNASKEEGQHYSVKAMERSKRALEDRLKRLSEQSKKDNVISFEQLGVDKMFVDEAHYYKNLFLVTKMRNVAGIGQSEAQKSTDLFMKCQYLDEKTDGKGIVFATGTPISNSMVELYTMQRYLQYSRLKDLDLEYFDDWASTFGESVTAMELAPEGTGYRFKTRFAKFNNLPELMSMFKEVADIKTADVLNLVVPKANYHNVIISPTDFQREYINSLAERVEAVHNQLVKPYEDNMLKVTNEGRKLALDQRLINPKASPGVESKVSACAVNVYKIWAETENNRSAQMVFCDLSTPNGKEFNVYDELKQLLVNKGVPEEEISFIHNAKSDLQKKNLFAKVRQGSVRVLIGSTQKMGAGTNVQERLAALHHLDCPWRPSDLEQREGRIIRQGNTNEEVEIYRYVTEATFDSYMWQLVENKQKFIAQIMTSNTPVRSAEDVDETSLSYGEVKALASGNPMIIEKCQLEAEVNKLNLQKASFLNDKFELEDKITQFYPSEIKRLEERIKKLTADLQCAEEHPAPEEGLSPMVLNGEVFLEKATAGDTILTACEEIPKGMTLPLGSYRGFNLFLSYTDGKFCLDLKNKLTHVVVLGADALGNIRRIDNVISDFPDNLQAEKEALSELRKQFKTAKEEVKCDFNKEQDLARKTEKLAKVNALLSAGQKSNKDNREVIQ